MACMWLLTLKNYTTPKQFVCKSDPFVSNTTISNDTSGHFYLDFNNGGSGTASNTGADLTYSYSIAYPWVPTGTIGVAGLWHADKTDSSLPLISDMAPQSGTSAGGITINQAAIMAAGGTITNGPKAVNSINHQREGQAVGYGDAHAEFVRRPDIGQNNDNIFSTYAATLTPYAGTGFAGSPVTNLSNYSTNPIDVVMVPCCAIDTGTRK